MFLLTTTGPRHRVFLLCAALALAGCAAPDDRYGDPGSGYPAAADKVLARVDWRIAERVTVRLDEFDFTPEMPVFKAGRPYELVLINNGNAGHTFTAGAFFRAIAAQSLGFAEGEARRPMLESIAVKAGEARILRFVPLTAGTYPLTCERPLHDIFGMTGTIGIE